LLTHHSNVQNTRAYVGIYNFLKRAKRKAHLIICRFYYLDESITTRLNSTFQALSFALYALSLKTIFVK
jgi:hypothetical protein